MEDKRKLTQDEVKRLEEFTEICNEFEQQGYKRKDLTGSIIIANVFSVAVLIVVFALGLSVFLKFNENAFTGVSDLLLKMGGNIITIVIVFLALTVVHELLHGLTWSLFSENHWKDVSFGFMAKYVTPYCSLKTPLKKGPYILGALMPLIVLGIIPYVISVITESSFILFYSLMMTAAAAGDMMIVFKILASGVSGEDVLVLDHPTMVGSVIFEK